MNETPRVLPPDEQNRLLVANVHPPGWTNPTPSGRYNLVVIGAGTAGLVTAAGAAGLGARVALVERHLMGGDCLNVGCVPSKSVIRSSRIVADVAEAASFGIRTAGKGDADFPAVMERMRRLRARISPNDSAERFQKDLGIDVYFGEARFAAADSVEVDGTRLQFKKAVIASGARPTPPPIEGLAETGYLTNETVFELTERPRRLAVIGAGPIGCELAQALRRLGSEVVQIDQAKHILSREDDDAAEILQRVFLCEGIRLFLSTEVKQARRDGANKVLRISRDGREEELRVDEILVGAGRAPNVEGLNLEAVGVEYDGDGVRVDDNLRTTNRRIFAAGDVCMRHKFTHMADAAARIVIQNALFFGSRKLSAVHVPWCTYTDPEIAHVGMYERDAREAGIAIEHFVRSFEHVDRAILDGEEQGFAKVMVKKGSDQIVGATIVARHAGEMISEVTLAMASGTGLGTLAGVVHPYPTQAEAIRQLGDAYNRTRLTPWVKSLFRTFLAWTR